MKKYAAFFATLLFICPALSHQPEFSDRTDMVDILEAYSERNGVKFVVDPRVRAKVNMIGVELEDIDRAVMNGILLLHGFVAYEKSDVVYVIPKIVEKGMEDQLGTKWGDK